MDRQKMSPAEPHHHHGHQHGDGHVRRHRTEPVASTRWSIRKAIAKHEQVHRTEPEHYQWMAVQAVSQTSPPIEIQEFLDGKSGDVADAASIEIARACMMMGVRLAPMVIGRESENGQTTAQPVIRGTV